MPRVHTKKKSKRGKKSCAKCGQKIRPGTKYYSWKFRYGGERNQHEECGYPRRGQLTQSKLAGVYDALDDAETTIMNSDSPGDIAEALQSAVETVREVAQEYTDAVEAMGAAGEGSESAERAEQLESFADELDNAASDIEGEEKEDEEDEDEWITGLREQATSALGECPL